MKEIMIKELKILLIILDEEKYKFIYILLSPVYLLLAISYSTLKKLYKISITKEGGE